MSVLVVGQFDICRMGIQNILEQMDWSGDLYEADTIDEGVAATANIDLDLTIIDLDALEIDRASMLHKVGKSGLKDNVILFSIVGDHAIKRRAYDMGVSAFIAKQTKKEIIISVIRIVLAGGRYFSPEVTGGRFEHPNESLKKSAITSPENRPVLSNRQLEVLELLSEGKPNKVIARDLKIATGTVKVHIAGILKSLKAKNRTQAVSIAKHINIL